ncbi:hypothetical protein C8Q79DRAFT_26515 [Trametes meyenii]|nr:hypothetical protein C8Q79DRAFT_26515 [Trametes meyenii]
MTLWCRVPSSTLLSYSPTTFMFALCTNLRLRSQLASQNLRLARISVRAGALVPAPRRGIATTAPAYNADSKLHRSTELGAVEETQDIATMDRLLKICSK